jgi:hypothetical protein
VQPERAASASTNSRCGRGSEMFRVVRSLSCLMREASTECRELSRLGIAHCSVVCTAGTRAIDDEVEITLEKYPL